MLVLGILLQFVWMIVTIVLSVAVLYVLLINRMVDMTESGPGAKCINLNHYGKQQRIR